MPALFLSIGVLALAVAGLLAARWAWQFATYDTAAGIVVENNRRCSQGRCTHHPVVEYVVDGERYRAVGEVGNATPLFDVGEAVSVRFAPGQPRDATLDHWTEHAFGPALGLGLGVIFSGIGLYLGHRQ